MRKILTVALAGLLLSSCGGGDSAPSSSSTAPVTLPTNVSGTGETAVNPPVLVTPPVTIQPTVPSTNGLEIGVYYYPGWHLDSFTGWKDPWPLIFPYPERKPQLGWYDDSSATVMRQQADWMSAYGISYVVFDWYYERGAVRTEGPMNAFIGLSGTKPKLSLLWANHTEDTTRADWVAIVDNWVRYARSSGFYTIDQRPVFFILNGQRFSDNADAAGESAKAWLSYARQVFLTAGLPEPYIVADTFAGDEPLIDKATSVGFSAVSSYYYTHPPNNPTAAHGFPELDASYVANWNRSVRDSNTPLIVPISSGWDMRPWGGYTADPLRDNSMPDVSQFRTHLLNAKAFMTTKGQKRAVICCWNEFGEGAYIEPTAQYGMTRLEEIKRVFAGQ